MNTVHKEVSKKNEIKFLKNKIKSNQMRKKMKFLKNKNFDIENDMIYGIRCLAFPINAMT